MQASDYGNFHVHWVVYNTHTESHSTKCCNYRRGYFRRGCESACKDYKCCRKVIDWTIAQLRDEFRAHTRFQREQRVGLILQILTWILTTRFTCQDVYLSWRLHCASLGSWKTCMYIDCCITHTKKVIWLLGVVLSLTIYKLFNWDPNRP